MQAILAKYVNFFAAGLFFTAVQAAARAFAVCVQKCMRKNGWHAPAPGMKKRLQRLACFTKCNVFYTICCLNLRRFSVLILFVDKQAVCFLKYVFWCERLLTNPLFRLHKSLFLNLVKSTYLQRFSHDVYLKLS